MIFKKIITAFVLFISIDIYCNTGVLNIGDDEIRGEYIGKYVLYLSEGELFKEISSQWKAEKIFRDKIKSGHLSSDSEFEVEIKSITGGYQANLVQKDNGARGKIEWTINALENEKVIPLFKKSDKDILSLNFIPHSFWLKFSINNTSEKNKVIYIEIDKYLFNLANLFYYDRGQLVEKRAYFTIPLSEREVKNKNIVFKINLEPGEKNFYMRVDNWLMDTVPVRLWTPDAYYEHRASDSIFQGIICGIYILIILYSLIIFMTMNDINYLYLSCMALSAFTTHVASSGIGFMYIWQENPSIGIYLFYASFPLSIVFTILFIRSYIQTSQYTPVIDIIMRAVIVSALIILPFMFFTPFSIQMDLFVLIYAIDHLYYYPFIFSSIVVIRKRNFYGFFMLVALGFFIFSQIEWVLTNLNIIPYGLVYYLNIKGIAFAIIVMAGLVYKIKFMSGLIAKYKDNLEKLSIRFNKKTITDETRIKIEKVKEFLKDNFRDDISREGLASAVDLSPDHMGRAFKKETGCKISDFINNLRINEAKNQLENTDFRIIDIAFAVGFESLRTFNKVFHLTQNMTPSEYRKNLAK